MLQTHSHTDATAMPECAAGHTLPIWSTNTHATRSKATEPSPAIHKNIINASNLILCQVSSFIHGLHNQPVAVKRARQFAHTDTQCVEWIFTSVSIPMCSTRARLVARKSKFGRSLEHSWQRGSNVIPRERCIYFLWRVVKCAACV